MAWAKIDDRFPRHPKALQAGPLGRDLFVCGLCYCGEHLTDGFIPASAISTLAPGLQAPQRIARLLVGLRLWELTNGGYRVHDYAEYQPSSTQVKAERKAVRERVRKWREARGNTVTSGVTDDVTNGVTNGVTDSYGNGNVTPPPSRPVPSFEKQSPSVGSHATTGVDASAPATAGQRRKEERLRATPNPDGTYPASAYHNGPRLTQEGDQLDSTYGQHAMSSAWQQPCGCPAPGRERCLPEHWRRPCKLHASPGTYPTKAEREQIKLRVLAGGAGVP